LESKSNLEEARRILRMGLKMYPKDHALLQAAGKVEERWGNVTAARDLFSASLHIELSAPALIAYALLELRSPEDETQGPNITMVRKLFNEALLIDPKHGPVYNAFGNLERRQGNVDVATQLYEDGINANCTDASSVYHGLAKLHLSLGEVEEARSVLQRGLALFGGGSSNNSNNNTNIRVSCQGKNANVAFLAHTLALIELNCNNNPTCAKSVLEQGLWHCGSSSQLLLAMALCESRLGNDAAARSMFEKSLMADQCHAQAWQSFGLMEMRAGNFKSAKTLFECGLKNSPMHGALWQAYGECLLTISRVMHYFHAFQQFGNFYFVYSSDRNIRKLEGKHQ
jgi:tetratricopeptide (TPR) repeat protein